MSLQLLPSRASALPATFKPTPCLSSRNLRRRPVHWNARPPHPWRRRRRVAVVSFAGEEVDAFTEYSGYLFEGGASEADLLEKYDLEAIASIYRRKPLVVLRRLVQIGTTFGKWFAVRYLDGLMERSDEMFKIRAAELRMILSKLGPAFIKVAQAVSSRPDIIPPTYLEELSLLQDRIAPFSTEVAFDMIEEELGVPIDMLFSEISPEPVAAASLGQVYQARIIPSGKLVAVKVQRPGVQAAISLDIFILRFLAGLLKKAAKLNTNLQAVVDEWASSLFREMDYREEGRNGLRFRKLYGSLQDVFVPEMYLDRSSRRVLIMEWVEGQKLSEVKDLYLVEVGVYCSLSQLLDYGFYHADPHPGNLLRTTDGKLAYLDFGMMGEFKQELRDGFIQACVHLVNRDFDELAKDFVTLGFLPPTAQKDEVTKALTGVFQNAVNKGVSNISFGDLSGNLGRTMYKFKFQIPSYFSLVIRSLAVLEGIAIGFNPEYKVLGSSYPWIARKILTDSSPNLRSTLQTLLYSNGAFRIDRLESLLTESLRAKTEQTLVRDAVQEPGSRLAAKKIFSFTLSDKGAFVREIILEEMVKGLDALGVATVDSVTTAAASRLPFVAPLSSSLMAEEDVENLRTLRRLLLLLSRLQKNESLSADVKFDNPEEKRKKADPEEPLQILNRLTSIQDFLLVLSIISELPSECQQQLLGVPADLLSKFASRAIARTLRRLFA
ncbi:unnamed protein product [Spirodela intermedia]|uniref:Protein kinase domain-containing protein n=1 Tax=Spirodela intermedia TaxID=51605 RepID=A0A7I8IP03_SPIIN|nr:unnamed protein product [Spirodela intermedia]CAA6659539.1 unnamed protein product [Spirodela intermedia]